MSLDSEVSPAVWYRTPPSEKLSGVIFIMAIICVFWPQYINDDPSGVTRFICLFCLRLDNNSSHVCRRTGCRQCGSMLRINIVIEYYSFTCSQSGRTTKVLF